MWYIINVINLLSILIATWTIYLLYNYIKSKKEVEKKRRSNIMPRINLNEGYGTSKSKKSLMENHVNLDEYYQDREIKENNDYQEQPSSSHNHNREIVEIRSSGPVLIKRAGEKEKGIFNKICASDVKLCVFLLFLTFIIYLLMFILMGF